MCNQGLVVLAGCIAFGVAHAEEFISAAPAAVELTIYRNANPLAAEDSIGMVREQRTVTVPAGRSRVVFRGVAALMAPQTTRIEGLPGRVLERNFDYDLLSPGALIAKSLGQAVQVVRTDPRSGRNTQFAGTLRAGPAGVVVESNGRLEPLDCGDSRDQLVFEAVPGGLAEVPTLSVEVEAERAGRYDIELSYLATGLAWSADYVARVQPDGRTLDLSGWLTLVNTSATTFPNVPMRAIAGNIAREDTTVPPPVATIKREARCWPVPQYSSVETAQPKMPDSEVVTVTGSYIREFEPQALGDYKLYALPETTTLAARQSKQLQFIDRRGVAFQRLYQVYLDADAEEPWILRSLRFQNQRAANLGLPLPRGDFIIMEPAARGTEVYAGEGAIADTPVGQRIELALQGAMDLTVRSTLLEEQQRADRGGVQQLRRLRTEAVNSKSVAVNVELIQTRIDSNFRIRNASQRFELRHGAAVWTLRLEPGATRVLEYSVQWLDATP